MLIVILDIDHNGTTSRPPSTPSNPLKLFYFKNFSDLIKEIFETVTRKIFVFLMFFAFIVALIAVSHKLMKKEKLISCTNRRDCSFQR